MKKYSVIILFLFCLCGNLSAEILDEIKIYMAGIYFNDNNSFGYYYKVGDLEINNIPIQNTTGGVQVSFLTVIDEKVYIGGNIGTQVFLYIPGEPNIEILPIFSGYSLYNIGMFKLRNDLYIYGEWLSYSYRSFLTQEALDLYNTTIPHAFYYKIGDLEPSPIPNPGNADSCSIADSVVFGDNIFFCGIYRVREESKAYAYYYRAGDNQINTIPIPANAVFSCANGIVIYNEKIFITGHFIEDDINEIYRAYYYEIGEENITLIPTGIGNINQSSGLAITASEDSVYILGDCSSNNNRMNYYYRVGDPNISIISGSENSYISNAFTNGKDVYFAGYNYNEEIWRLCYYKVGNNSLNIISPFKNIERIQVHGTGIIKN